MQMQCFSMGSVSVILGLYSHIGKSKKRHLQSTAQVMTLAYKFALWVAKSADEGGWWKDRPLGSRVGDADPPGRGMQEVDPPQAQRTLWDQCS